MKTIKEINEKFLNGDGLVDEELIELFLHYEKFTSCMDWLDQDFGLFTQELWKRRESLWSYISARGIEKKITGTKISV